MAESVLEIIEQSKSGISRPELLKKKIRYEKEISKEHILKCIDLLKEASFIREEKRMLPGTDGKVRYLSVYIIRKGILKRLDEFILEDFKMLDEKVIASFRRLLKR